MQRRQALRSARAPLR